VSVSSKLFRSKSSFLNNEHIYSILIFAVLSFQIFKIYHSVKTKSRCDVNPLFSPKISLFRSLERSLFLCSCFSLSLSLCFSLTHSLSQSISHSLFSTFLPRFAPFHLISEIFSGIVYKYCNVNKTYSLQYLCLFSRN